MENNPEAAFVAFDKETLKAIENEQPYKTAADSATSLAWTPEDTEYETNTNEGNRWSRALSFFSDGELIYTMVQYREKGKDSKVVRTSLEIYELEDHELRLMQEIPLYKNDEKEPFTGRISH